MCRADGRRDDAGPGGAVPRAGRVRHGLRRGHRADHGDADGHQLHTVRAGRHRHVAVRLRARRHGVRRGRVLPLPRPGAAAQGPGHERPVHRQPVRRAGRVRRGLPAGRVLRDQVAHDEQTVAQDTAVLQEAPARMSGPVPPPVRRSGRTFCRVRLLSLPYVHAVCHRHLRTCTIVIVIVVFV